MKNKFIVATIVAMGLLCIQAVSFFTAPTLDIGTLYNYSDIDVPEYIFKEKTFTDEISDELATLGRVLFYDTKLSLNSTISCASCHQQEFAFGDTTLASKGFDGRLTERHSTRLVNLNYNHMPEVFWDLRSPHLDSLPLMVLTNAIEMGFSGKEGQPEIDSLVRRLEDVDYYEPLFELGFGDRKITEDRINVALTQFVKSIVSFDSRYDVGLDIVGTNKEDFPNFSSVENFGKRLFLSPFAKNGHFEEPDEGREDPIDGGVLNMLGCAECHGADNFTSRKTSLTGNNGIVGVIGHPELEDTTVLRSPSMRNLFTPDGKEIGPFMHDGSLKDLRSVIMHYITIGINDKVTGLHSSLDIDRPNRSYDGRDGPSGWLTPVRASDEGVDALVAFLKTLTDESFFTNKKWSDPFDSLGNIIITNDCELLPEGYEHVTICAGDSYKGFYTEGLHKTIIERDGPCDSILAIDLQIEELIYIEEDTIICQGEFYEGTGVTERFSVIEESQGTCYHRDIMLTVVDSIHEHLDLKLCFGESIYGYSETGHYRDTLYLNGCETYRLLDVEVRPIEHKFVEFSICPGSSFYGYHEEGVYIDTVQIYSWSQCLGIRELHLKVLEFPEKSVTMQICEGEDYEGFDETGFYQDTIPAQLHRTCDTIRTIDLVVMPLPERHIQKEICFGDSYQGYHTSGLYANIIPAEEGCDTTLFVDLTVLDPSFSYVEHFICEGESIENYSETGIYYDQFIDVNGCDSLRQLELIVFENDESEEFVSICDGESYRQYTESGVYLESYTNSFGCDSTVVIELDVLNHSESLEYVEICEGQKYQGYSESGIYTDMFLNAAGCDSTRVIDLEVRPVIETYIEEHICKGEKVEGYFEEGIYSDQFKNAEGCDSLRHLKVLFLPDTESVEEIHLCPGEEFEGHYHATEYEEYYVNHLGCDSIRLVRIINLDRSDAICTEQWDHNHKRISDSDFIQLYPNPIEDVLNVNISKPKREFQQVIVYNLNHQIVIRQELKDKEMKIDFSDLDAGVYMIQLIDRNNKFVGKVLKI